MYAIVEIKGKQYKAVEGALLKVDLIDAAEGSAVDFESVIAVSNGDKVAFGGPYVSGAKVATVCKGHVKGDKIVVYKYKRRKGYERKQGHRQNYTLLEVKSVKG